VGKLLLRQFEALTQANLNPSYKLCDNNLNGKMHVNEDLDNSLSKDKYIIPKCLMRIWINAIIFERL
jgi:hypothetical protein